MFFISKLPRFFLTCKRRYRISRKMGRQSYIFAKVSKTSLHPLIRYRNNPEQYWWERRGLLTKLFAFCGQKATFQKFCIQNPVFLLTKTDYLKDLVLALLLSSNHSQNVFLRNETSQVVWLFSWSWLVWLTISPFGYCILIFNLGLTVSKSFPIDF